MFSDLRYRLRALFRRSSLEAELDQEVRAHIEQQAEKYIQSGMSPEEASRRSRVEFGGVEQVKEECREAWGVRFISELAQDLRYGLRQLRRNPGFTAVAILTLALGIGANTAIFSLIYSLILRQLPVRQPGQLVELWASNSHDRGLLSLPMLEELRRRQKVFSGMAAWACPLEVVEINNQTVLGATYIVTPNYFSMLGVSPLIGRFFAPGESGNSKTNYDHIVPAVISYRFWQDHFNGNRDALGKTVKVYGHPWTIVGVARKDFFGTYTGLSADIWVPTRPESLTNRKTGDWVTARLKSGVSIQQARAQLQAIWPSVLQASAREGQTEKRRNEFMSQRLWVQPAGAGILAPLLIQFRRPLWILMGAVGFVLLIACVNLAQLLLARAGARQHEIGVRIALGATRRRMLRQMLTESLMLSVAGAALGFPFAYWTSRFLAHLIWAGNIVPLSLNLNPDLRVFGFAAVAAVATGVLFGLAPAWRASR